MATRLWETAVRVRNRSLRPFSRNFFENNEVGARERFGSSELSHQFRQKRGAQVHKWHHYLDIYERHLGDRRGTPFRLLEIGVFRGGSLELWRSYFGEKAVIFGVDIDPGCAQCDGRAGQVRIGSQADPTFLRSVVEEMGGVDVVIDDGSHDSRHMYSSFDTLFPLLSDGGIYIAEDLHCCYWPKYSGGYFWPWSFINVAKRMIDDMHHWYHGRGQRIPASKGHLQALHVYDSMIVLEKRAVPAPVSTIRPDSALADEGPPAATPAAPASRTEADVV